MRNAILWVVLELGFIAHTVAQQPATEPPTTSQPDAKAEATHAALRELKSVMEEALNKGDVTALLAHVEDDVVFTTMNGDVAIGKDAIRTYFSKMMTGPDRVVDKVVARFIPEAKSILYGDDMAVDYGHTNDHYVLKGGRTFDVEARWSCTMVRRNGAWRIANFHYSTNMFDNPILTAQRRMLIVAGIIGCLVFAALGFWIGRRRKRVGP